MSRFFFSSGGEKKRVESEIARVSLSVSGGLTRDLLPFISIPSAQININRVGILSGKLCGSWIPMFLSSYFFLHRMEAVRRQSSRTCACRNNKDQWSQKLVQFLPSHCGGVFGEVPQYLTGNDIVYMLYAIKYA